MFGLVPAALACVADWIARHLHSLIRMGVTAIVGCAATFLSMFLFSNPHKVTFATTLAYGLVGLVPAGVSFWLAEN